MTVINPKPTGKDPKPVQRTSDIELALQKPRQKNKDLLSHKGH